MMCPTHGTSTAYQRLELTRKPLNYPPEIEAVYHIEEIHGQRHQRPKLRLASETNVVLLIGQPTSAAGRPLHCTRRVHEPEAHEH